MLTRISKIKIIHQSGKLPASLSVLQALLKRALVLTLEDQKMKAALIAPGDILAILCGDKEIRRVKKLFWGKAITTDVVSLNYGRAAPAAPRPSPSPSVEIIINTQQAKRQRQWGWKEEIVFLFIHGMLHAMGWDDDTPAKRKKMLDLGEKILWRTLTPKQSKK